MIKHQNINDVISSRDFGVKAVHKALLSYIKLKYKDHCFRKCMVAFVPPSGKKSEILGSGPMDYIDLQLAFWHFPADIGPLIKILNEIFSSCINTSSYEFGNVFLL